MSLKKKLIIIGAAALIVVVVAIGIIIPVIYKNGKGIDIGNYTNDDAYMSIKTRVKSKKSDYNIDEDIVLNFYYGSEDKISTNYYDEDKGLGYLDGVGIFICNVADLPPFWPMSNFTVENFKKIANIKCCNFIYSRQYDSYDFRTRTSIFGKTKFKHLESITVPKSIIDPEKEYCGSNYFCLFAAPIIRYSYTCYDIYNATVIYIKYDFLDENTIRISEPVEQMFNL